MGCGASQADIAKYAALEQQKNELELKIQRMEQDFAKIQDEMAKQQQKNGEQCNLLRFKIEVLVHMLAMEEKKLEAAVKRLDALKWAMLTQGLSEKSMNNILASSQGKSGSSGADKDILLTSAFDLSGAIDRMQKEFAKGKESIVSAFADSDGRISDALSREEFCRILFATTESLSKSDVQV
jgi:hypothetical protein